jgi:pimeloyl-ACP methyl ester carboxylesterase
MSTDGYLHGTRGWPLFGAFLSFYPVQQLVLKEPPQLAFSLTQRVCRDIAKPGPHDQGPAVHSEDLCSLFGIQELVCHWSRLRHGFPTSSFQYRDLIPRLADRYRVIAPDLPGFGFTEVPAERGYTYSFEALAKTIFAFTQALKLTRYAMYVFDYGAPTGFRLALMAPERVTAIVSQNGNAYEQGLGDAWRPIQRYWREPTLEHRNAIRSGLTLDGMRHEYSVGIPDPGLIKPEGYTLDAALVARPGNVDIQLDLFLDYADNVKLYPKFQEYFRNAKPPLLAV